MTSEMRSFALNKATEAGDLIAEELFRRADRVDIDVVKNEYSGISFWFTFAGATVEVKWTKDCRFNDPEVVYNIMLQLIYQGEDAPRPKTPTKKEDEGAFGFVFGVEDDGDDEESEEDTNTEWNGPEFKL